MGYLGNLFTKKERRTMFDDASALSTSPSGGPLEAWAYGVVGALIPVGYGIYCIHSGHTYLPGRGQGLDLTGKEGLRLAIAYIAAGSVMHFHFFWGLTPRLWNYADLGKVASLLVFIWGLGSAIWLICTKGL